ncbi:MAG: disulfide bond formation protein B [Holosporaceae bacterium]|jgi:disulfide bond formation protein DsbB|nr:disulfide bond formation protein B [Holosporaceae bacterium]
MKEFFKKISHPHVGLPISLFILYAPFIYSFISEYFFQNIPCKLQLIQRGSVVVCIIFITLALLLKNNRIIYKQLVNFSCLVLAVGGAAALCNLLLQYNIIGDWFLRENIPQNVSVEEMEAIVLRNMTESCANINSTLFGIPDSAYFLAIFIFLLTYLWICFKIFDEDEQ